jgi:hypothetical protein
MITFEKKHSRGRIIRHMKIKLQSSCLENDLFDY